MDKSGKISIFYFSGTGNTKWVAEKTSEKLNLKGFSVETHSIEKINAEEIIPDDFEQIGIMFPVYSSTAPPPMVEFLKKLPKANGTPVFAVACAWLFGGHTAFDYTNQLSENGYKPYLFANVLMPNNINLPPFGWIPIKNGKQIRSKLMKAERKIERLISKIINLEPLEEGNSWLSRKSDNAQRKGADNEDMVNYYVDENCISCGWCVENCPTNNIQFDDNKKPVFGDNCISCVRCYSRCPKEAIQSRYKNKSSSGYVRYKGPHSP